MLSLLKVAAVNVVFVFLCNIPNMMMMWVEIFQVLST